jgi:hypothetical protein
MSDDESRFVTVHDRVRQKMMKTTHEQFGYKHPDLDMKEYVAPTQTDLDEIKQALKYILQKLTSLDDYVRQHRYKPGMYEKRLDKK